MNRRESLKLLGGGALAAAGVPLMASAVKAVEPFEWSVGFPEGPGPRGAIIETNDAERALRLIRAIQMPGDPRPAVEFVGKEIVVGATVESVHVIDVRSDYGLPAGTRDLYLLTIVFDYSAGPGTRHTLTAEL